MDEREGKKKTILVYELQYELSNGSFAFDIHVVRLLVLFSFGYADALLPGV